MVQAECFSTEQEMDQYLELVIMTSLRIQYQIKTKAQKQRLEMQWGFQEKIVWIDLYQINLLSMWGRLIRYRSNLQS